MNHKLFTALLLLVSWQISIARTTGQQGILHPTYALVISIGSYPQQPSWPAVDSKKDAGNIEFFIKQFAPDAAITILRDQSATKKNIISSLSGILQKLSAGDNMYIHFSGGGFRLQMDTAKQVFMPYDAPSVEDAMDAAVNNKQPDLSNAITDKELIDIIQKIRLKSGINGQFFFTMDASHFGPKNSSPQSLVGRGGFLKITDTEAGLAPFIMLTSCLDNEESYFTGNKEPYNRSFSAAIRKYCENFQQEKPVNYSELFSGIKQQMTSLAPLQTVAIAGPAESRYVLGGAVSTKIGVQNNNSFPKDARLFILSIGISNYKGPYAFANCDDDAVLFTKLMKSSWRNGDTSGIKTWILLNNEAKKDAILIAINEIISQAKDDDVFAFFFAGFTNEPKNKDGSYMETWFYPQTDKPVNINYRTGFNEKEIISLRELKKLFDYIKSDKQLLFTEAGLTENFKREFIKSMIKTNPVITEIRKRNRVILVPDKTGWDAVLCDGQNIQHGPGLYFFYQLASSVNIFGLFSDEASIRMDVVYKYRNEQFKCKYREQYISFFFEKEFVEDLQYYFTKDVSLKSGDTRGAGEKPEDEKIIPPVTGNKYALVIGTDKFNFWNKLQNPVRDATSIADTLRDLFGFKTTILLNPGIREIYNSLYSFRNILKEDDQFVLYLAGHGYYDSTIFKDGFIVASDSKSLKADTFLNSYIPFSQLRSIADNYKSRQIMVLLDVCFSGAFDDNAESLSGNINYNLTGKLNDRTVGKKLLMTTRKYITAGSKTEEVGDDYNGEHSPFAYFLLEGLRRAAKEKKYLSSGMLYKFIQSYLEDTIPLQAGFGKDQERSGSEFIFIAK